MPADGERLLAAAQLIFAMFGMGAVSAPRDFVAVLRSPRALGLGLGIQLILVPMLAWGLGIVLPVTAGVAAGLVLVAAVPGGTISNVFTYLVGGNVALSVSLTAITTVGALVTTPAILTIALGSAVGEGVVVPVDRVARDIVLTLLVPLALGMVCGALLPARREDVARWAVRASLVCIAALAILGARAGRLDPTTYGPWGIGAIVAFALGAQLVALGVSRLGGLPRADMLAVAIEATIRNTNLALLVQTSLAAGVGSVLADGMFFVALLYGGVALAVACLPLVPWPRVRGGARRWGS